MARIGVVSTRRLASVVHQHVNPAMPCQTQSRHLKQPFDMLRSRSFSTLSLAHLNRNASSAVTVQPTPTPKHPNDLVSRRLPVVPISQSMVALGPLSSIALASLIPHAAAAPIDGAGVPHETVTAAGYALSPPLLTALQVAGPCFFLALQISGLASVRQIVKTKSTGGLSMLPFISLFTNCVIWTWYGHLIADPTVLLPNCSGVVLGGAYTLAYLRYSKETQLPLLVGSGAIVSAISAAALSLPTETALPIIGYTGDVLAVILMASPLATVKTVLQEKSTRALPFPVSMATFLNAASWTCYGYFVMGDPLIWIPNALGLLASVVQLSLFARFGIHKAQ
eukprot:m.370072 g.370072  ORF g.370072 m.370072 type:complete len:338 (-) comp52081_c0_seq1:214-1227(-)